MFCQSESCVILDRSTRLSFLNRFFGRTKKVRTEVEKPTQFDTERSERSKIAKWRTENLSELVYTTVCPEKKNWDRDLPDVQFCYSDTSISFRAFRVNDQLCWYQGDKWGDNYTEFVYAPSNLVDQWYADAWAKGDGFVWLPEELHTERREAPVDADTCKATPKLALHILSSLVNGLSCYGDDFVRWIATHIGVDALRILAMSGAPNIEVKLCFVYRYAKASKFFRIPLNVQMYDGSWKTGYGDPNWDWDWVPVGMEENAHWPTKETVLRSHDNDPEFVKLWVSLFPEDNQNSDLT